MAIPPFDPASEPLGSTDPRVREVNSKLLDLGIHSKEDKFTDRFGEEKMTWEAMQNERIGLLIAGGQIFPSEAEGRAAAEDGWYFYAVSPNPNVTRSLYRRISASESEHIKDDPSAEFVEGVAAASNAALALASQPGLLSNEFLADNEEEGLFFITDEAGNAIAAWDKEGFQINPARGEFHSSESDAVYAITDENGKHLFSVDKLGQMIAAWASDFFTSGLQSEYAWVSREGVVLYEIDKSGRFIGGESSGSLPKTDYEMEENARWSNKMSVDLARGYSSLYRIDVYDSFTDHLSIYAFVDELAARHPDYCSTAIQIGSDESGNAINAYRLKPDVYRDSTDSYPLSDLTLPKAVVIGLTHGNEQQSAAANLLLISEMCEQWANLPGLEALRWGAEIIFIPCLNPWGYDNRSRYNANGVDLNRNFPVGWDESTNSRKGSAPASELGTQAIIEFIANEQSAAPIAGLVDHHRMFGLPTNGLSIWMGARGDETLGVCSQAIQKSIAFTRSRITDALQYNPGGRLTNTIDGGLTRYFQAQGINSYLLESPSLVGNGKQLDALRINRENVKILTSLILEQANSKRLVEYPNPSPEHGSV